MKLGDVLIFAFAALILFVAVTAIIRGRAGMKESKLFDTSDKKIKVGYWLFSCVHMSAGIFVAFIMLFFVIFSIVTFFNNLGGR